MRNMKWQNVTSEYLHTAEPGHGLIEYDDNYKIGSHQDEVQIANWLHNIFGGDIRLLIESKVPGVKTPDYIWRGRAWELKGANSINSADKSLRHAIKQIQSNPGGVVLNILENIEMSALEQQLASRIQRSQIANLDLIILLKGTLKKVLRYKK